MLLNASRRAHLLQMASCELEMEKFAFAGSLGRLAAKQIGKGTAGLAKAVKPAPSALSKVMKPAASVKPGLTLPPKLTSAQRTAMIAEPVLPAASVARATARNTARSALRPGAGSAMSLDQRMAGTVANKVALASLGPEKLAALALALEQQKEAGLLGAAFGGAKGLLKGLKAGGSAGAKATTTAKALGSRRHQLQVGLRSAKSGWRKGMDPIAAKAKSLGGLKGGAISPEAMAGATKAVPAAAAKVAPGAATAAPAVATAAPAVAGGGLGLGGGTALLAGGGALGVGGVLSGQGALKGRSAQFVGPMRR